MSRFRLGLNPQPKILCAEDVVRLKTVMWLSRMYQHPAPDIYCDLRTVTRAFPQHVQTQTSEPRAPALLSSRRLSTVAWDLWCVGIACSGFVVCHHCLLGVRACVSSTGCFELVVCQHWLLGACVCQHCLLLSLRVSMEHCAAGRQLSNCPASWSACLEHICRQHFVEVCTDMEAGRFRLLCMFCCGCVEPMIPCALRCHCALTNCYS